MPELFEDFGLNGGGAFETCEFEGFDDEGVQGREGLPVLLGE